MEKGENKNNNFNSLINNLIKLNKELQNAIAAAKANIEIAKAFCNKLDQLDSLKKKSKMTSETRLLAIEKLKHLN
jgi:hypothetical protein